MLRFQKYNSNIPCVTISAKWTFQKSKSRISTSNIHCVPIFRQSRQLWFFQPKISQKLIGKGWKFRKLMSEQESTSSRYNVCQFSVKMDNFDICCRYLDGGWNEVGGVRWSWLEVGAAGWRWLMLSGVGCAV